MSYLIYGGKIISINGKSLDIWEQNARENNFQYVVCKPVVRKRLVYFADSTGGIFAFDLESYLIKRCDI